MIAHGGDTQWFHSELQLFVDDGIGLFVAVNSTGRDGAAWAVLGALIRDFADRYLPGTAPRWEGRFGRRGRACSDDRRSL